MADAFPSKFSDLSISKKANELTGVDVDGQHYTAEEAYNDNGLRQVMQGKTDQVYKSALGGYTTSRDLATGDTSVSMDRATGKITIKAPKSVLESSSFKSYFGGDSSLLKQYSAAYQSDHSYKVPYQNEDGSETQITIPELVSKWDEAIQKMGTEQINFVKNRAMLGEQNQGANNFNIDQVRIALSAPINRGDVKASGTDRLVLPEWFFNINLASTGAKGKAGDIKNLSTFAITDGIASVERDDFLKNWYNLDNLNADAMRQIYGELSSHLKLGDWEKDSDYYKTDEGLFGEEGEEYNKVGITEMAKTIALQSFIAAEDPSGDLWQKAGLTAESFGFHFGIAASKAFYGTASMLENAAGFLTNNLDNWTYFSKTTQDLQVADDYYGEAMGMINDAGNAISGIAELGGYLAGSWAAGKAISAVGSAAGKAGGAIADKLTDTATASLTTEVADTATKLGIGNFVNSNAVGAELVGEANALGKVAMLASQTDNIAKGASFMVSTLNSIGKITDTFSKAVSISKAIKGTPLVGTTLEFLVDTVRDAAMMDPMAVKTILKGVRNGTVSEKDVEYAKEQLVQNAMSWAVFRGALTGLKFSTKTTVGKAMNLKVSQWVNTVDAWSGDKTEALKTRIFGKSTVEKLSDHLDELTENSAAYRRVYNKLQKAEANDLLRKAKHTFASGDWDDTIKNIESRYGREIGKDLTGLKKWVAEGQAVQNNIRNLNNMIDHMKGYVVNKTAEMADPNREFFTGMTNKNLVDWDSKLAEAEGNAAGLTYDADHTMMSVESSNYMGLSIAKEHAEKIANMDGAKGQAAAKRELPKIEARLQEVADSLPAEVKSVLDDGIGLYRKEYAALSEYEKAYGLTNLVSREGLEDMDLWEGGYVRTQRVQEDTGVRFTTETGERLGRVETTEYNYVFDAGRDYQDFEIVRTRYRNQIAQASYAKELQQTYLIDGNATKKVYISAEQTEYARKMENAKKYFYKDAQAAANEAAVDLKVSTKAKASKQVPPIFADQAVSGLDYRQSSDILLGMGYQEGSLVAGYRDVDIAGLGAKKSARMWDEFKGELNKNARDYLDQKGVKNLDDLQTAIKSGSDFEAGLNRAFLRGDKDFMNSDTLREILNSTKNRQMDFFKSSRLNTIKNEMKDYNGKLKKPVGSVVDGVADWSESYLDEYTTKASESWSAKTVGEARAVDLNGDEGLLTQHAVLSTLEKNKNRYDSLDDQLTKELKGVALTDDERAMFFDRMHEEFDTVLESRINNIESQLLESNPDMPLRDDIFRKAADLNQKITETENAIKAGVQSKKSPSTCWITALDENGAKVIYEVDPALAGLYNRRMNLSKTEAGAFAKVNYAMSKTFRLGTTTANLTSFGRQFFKDSQHGVIVGGMWDTLKANSENFRDVFGDDVIDQLKDFDDYQYRQVMAMAEDQGITVREALLNREISRATNIATESAEYKAYQEFRKALNEGRDKPMNVLAKMNDAVQRAEEKVDSIMNGVRENYLRKNVYMSNINKALENGYSINQARVLAEFAERNATTNFGRSLYHLQSISESTPYFGAAINGTKSFWRMFELDPVGITGRFMGGAVLPMMFFTANNLASEENRKVYQTLPEYKKEGSFVYIQNGQVMTMPIPEELTSLVSPFRHFVEHLYNADQYSFWQLAQNDLLGLSPIDLQGFSDVDMDRMAGDPTLADRLGRGVARVFSQVAPVPLKSTYMAVTQTDPYTGKKISGNIYYYYDEETGTLQRMDYTTNQFAKNMARFFNMDNPSIIEKVASSVIGTTGTDILGFLWGLGTVVGDSGMTDEELQAEQRSRYTISDLGTDVAKTVTERITKPFYEETYDQTNAAWRREVKVLQDAKTALLNDPKVKQINTQLNQESDPEKRKKLLAQRQNYVDKYAEQVKTVVNNLVNTYGGTIDRHKYAAVISLLNFNSDPVWSSGSQYSSDLASDSYYDSRTQAIRTMEELGVDGTTDGSIFGYLYTNRNGETKIKYSLPTAILDAQNTWYSAKTMNLKNVSTLIENAGLKNQRSAMWAQLKAVDSKDYDKKDDIRDSWNQKVIATIAPYIETMSAEAILKDENMIKYLEQWIEVPSYWEKVNNKFISSGYNASTGEYKLDKNMAFIESYLRKVLED